MKEQFKTKITPRIPKGFTHLEGTPEDGFVIVSTHTGNQFVWIPVEVLTPNGTANNGITFDSRFGRRSFGSAHMDLTTNEFWEEETPKLQKQRELVEKYGGFYISRYNISEHFRSIPDATPIIDINQYDAGKAAHFVERSEDIASRLMYGSEYDSTIEFLIESGAKSFEECTEDCQTTWGNLWTSKSEKMGICKSDANPAWAANRIFDLNGNAATWTLEKYGDRNQGVIRGKGWDGCFSVVFRGFSNSGKQYRGTGYRVALQWIH